MCGVSSSAARPDVLWLFGPPGVGKTATGWSLYRAWSAEGTPTGYVDIDQLGMLYPTTDPRNHRVKARNLAAALDAFAAADVRRVVVSGVVDPDEMADFAHLGGGTRWVWCRLTAPAPAIRHRLTTHRDQPEMVHDAIAHAELLDRHDIADLRVDTGGRTVDEVVEVVRAAVGSRSPGPSRIGPAPAEEQRAELAVEGMPSGCALTVIAVTGPRAVGKSTVAWEVFQRVQREGRVAAFLDLEQIGFVSSGTAAPSAMVRDVRVTNVGVMARIFAEAGATVLVLSGPIADPRELAAYTAALAPAQLTVVRLTADDASVRDRVAHRSVQRLLHLPGDDLRDLSAEAQRDVVQRSLRDGREVAAASVGHPVNTDGRPVDQIAEDVLAQVR